MIGQHINPPRTGLPPQQKTFFRGDDGTAVYNYGSPQQFTKWSLHWAPVKCIGNKNSELDHFLFNAPARDVKFTIHQSFKTW